MACSDSQRRAQSATHDVICHSMDFAASKFTSWKDRKTLAGASKTI
jgi:hypothetical protein